MTPSSRRSAGTRRPTSWRGGGNEPRTIPHSRSSAGSTDAPLPLPSRPSWEIRGGPWPPAGRWSSSRPSSRGASDRGHGWVAKAEHANAGLGNRRLRARHLDEPGRRWAEGVFAEDDVIHLEPWAARVADLTAVFEVTPSGRPRGASVHEVVTTSDGAFLGALFAPRPRPGRERWHEEMFEAADRVARVLASEGYWGPACIDGLVWSEGGASRLRALTDLNARGHVSAGGRALARHLDPDATAYWRFYATRRMRRFDSLAELIDTLAPDAYDPERCRGALPTSPLWLEGQGRRRRAVKLGMLLLAGSTDEALTLDARVRERLER